MDEFDAEGVDGYRQFEVAQAAERAEAIERGEPIRLDPDDPRSKVMKPLAPRTINKTIDILQAILARRLRVLRLRLGAVRPLMPCHRRGAHR